MVRSTRRCSVTLARRRARSPSSRGATKAIAAAFAGNGSTSSGAARQRGDGSIYTEGLRDVSASTRAFALVPRSDESDRSGVRWERVDLVWRGEATGGWFDLHGGAP